LVLTNKQYDIIEESAIIVSSLEANGYKVSTFTNSATKTYGLEITVK